MKGFLCLGFACFITSAFAEANCNVDAAYAQGMDDARNQASIQTQYGNNCYYVNRAAINQAYRDGYAAGAQMPLAKRQCLKTDFGEACGYDCKRGNYGEVRCAKYPTQQCLVDQFGKVHCGYSCVKSQQGKVKCARSYLDNCVINNYGQIRCGRNCRITVAGIRCDGNVSY